MNYRDSIIKQSKIKWKPQKIRYVDDGDMDFVIRIPLKTLIEAQAKQSFAYGISEAFNFMLELSGKGEQITEQILLDKLTDWELPELIELVKSHNMEGKK